MMRTLLPLLLCSAVTAAPGAALAQEALGLEPLPTIQPAQPASPAVAAKPPPAPVHASAEPIATEAPTVVAPMLVEKPEKNGLGDKIGAVVGGVAGGAAGAAVAGPVGKFAGGFLGKHLTRSLFGGKKDDIPELTVAEAAPSADAAAQPAVAAPATAPPPGQSATLAEPGGAL